ncbi:MAG: hypothetical protein JW384_03418 [Nitrosomonadaceae bacterium]|nr:hypothetical protein [Nitrosomonadaceae bacterium]
MNIYVASSWRNNYQPIAVKALRLAGHEVYDYKNPEGETGFHWSDIDPDWEQWNTRDFIKALDNPIAVKGFNSDMEALENADCTLLVLPCGRSAHLELGFAVGDGQYTMIWSPKNEEPELMYRMIDFVTDDLEIVLERLAVLGKAWCKDTQVVSNILNHPNVALDYDSKHIPRVR